MINIKLTVIQSTGEIYATRYGKLSRNIKFIYGLLHMALRVAAKLSGTGWHIFSSSLRR